MMSDNSLILADADSYARGLAPVELAGCPAVAIDYDELGIDNSVDGGRSRGLSAFGLDRFAAIIRRDDRLVGRPIVAVAIDRAIADAIGHPAPATVARCNLRRTLAHELAHAVLDRVADRDYAVVVEAYRALLAQADLGAGA